VMTRAQELCRKLKPVLGSRIDRLYHAYLAEDAGGRAEIEQTLELLAAKHLMQTFEPDRNPFPPPDRAFAGAGDIPLGHVAYGGQELYPFTLRSGRLREHVLVAGRSGSGKTNLTFMLMLAMMRRGIRILALDWKRGYRDLMALRPDLQVYTVGRDVAPVRFNPLIPPPGCEPQVWIKLIVDVMASAYFGGEGVISLLVGGLDHLYREAGVGGPHQTHWPTIQDLLAWLRTAKLKGRAAMWQASAERILLAMTYGEFGSVLHTQSNAHVQELLGHNVVLEMDGLSSSSDRVMFSEGLTLYLYRLRLAEGPKDRLTNMIIIEEAHNLLLAKQAGARESVLEGSIRMIRQYGLGYVFVDQSASLLSKVAFANSYCTIAMSQKLQADVRAMASAMNLTDEQKQALSTLPIGTAVVRLADQRPEPFQVRVPRCPVREGSVSDQQIRARMQGCLTDSSPNTAPESPATVVPPVPAPDRNDEITRRETSHPPAPKSVTMTTDQSRSSNLSKPPVMSSEEIRFLADAATRPLSTTVSRYQRLHLSRRRGNAIRQHLSDAGIIEAVPIATRSGQVILYQLTDFGRTVCSSVQIDPGPPPRATLEHAFWARRATEYFQKKGFEVTQEHFVDGNGHVDLLAERPGERIAIEVETGKSDIAGNIEKVQDVGFDRVVLVATSPAAVGACQKTLTDLHDDTGKLAVELLTWLDVS